MVEGWWRWLRPDKRLKCAENERVKWGRMCWCFYPLYVRPGCSLIKMMMSRELPVLITFYLHFRLTSFWSHLKLNIYLRGHTRPGWRGWCCGGRKIIFICQLLIINLAKTPCRICEEVLIYGEKLVYWDWLTDWLPYCHKSLLIMTFLWTSHPQTGKKTKIENSSALGSQRDISEQI